MLIRSHPFGRSVNSWLSCQRRPRTSSAAHRSRSTTTWAYWDNTGWLYCKDYPDPATGEPPAVQATQGPSYTYSLAGRLLYRQFLEGLTTYTHDYAGDLSAVSYQRWDTTPAISYTRDRLGRQTQITSTDMWLNDWDCNLIYNYAGQLVSESYSGGPLDGLVVTNTFDPLLRRTNLSLLSGAGTLATAGYSYDPSSRLQAVTDGASSATYSYLANSPLVSQITFTNNGLRRMVTSKAYDFLNRLTQISSVPSASSVVSFSYSYNNGNQRVRSTLQDGGYWSYEYDSLGQVKSGKKFWADGTPVAGQQMEYAFDDIGNRTWTKAGGDQNGASLRSATYGANLVNQYTNRTVPGAVDVMGVALATSTVSVAGETPYRKGEYFRKELSVDNSTSAVCTNITVTATGQASVSGHAYVPATPESFSHDADGNLVEDGRWHYTWDGENRLVAMEASWNVSVPDEAKLKLEFAYDWQGRRVSKIVYTNYVGNYVPAYTNNFVYDGWNLVAVLSPQSSVLQSFLWGLDLSGSLQGAGGVGGLLTVAYHGTQTTNCFVAFDGNGNVAALITAAYGTLAARYEYGPFGELLRATGPMAKVNPFRFSTKFQDAESDLLYYGYRYYSAATGRWSNRDPMEEHGGVAIHAICENDAVNRIDRLGLNNFSWVIPHYENRPPRKVGRAVAFGGTSWREFKPRVKMYQRPGAPCCYGLMFDGEFAQVTVWFVKGDKDALAHEVYHVTHHFYPAYLDYKHEAESYFSPCKTKAVAECLKTAIEGSLKDEYKALAHALSIRWDCDLGDTDACTEMPAYIEDYLAKALATQEAIQSCLRK